MTQKKLKDDSIQHQARIITYPDIKKRKLISLLTNDLLIANLLLTIMQKSLKRTWSFSGLATRVRILLMYYIDFNSFFEGGLCVEICINKYVK